MVKIKILTTSTYQYRRKVKLFTFVFSKNMICLMILLVKIQFVEKKLNRFSYKYLKFTTTLKKAMSLTRKFRACTKCLTKPCRKNNRATSYLLLFLLFFYIGLLTYSLNSWYDTQHKSIENLTVENGKKIGQNILERNGVKNVAMLDKLKGKNAQQRL